MIHDLIKTSKNMEWSYSTSLTKSLSDLGPKGITKYTNGHTNIGKTQSVFRLTEN